MSAWLHFLERHGARTDNSDAPRFMSFGNIAAPEAVPPASGDFVAPLTDLGLIAATGEDAAHFLHNQLTNDVEHLADGAARLAGYCSPKGRMLASLLLWKDGDTILLQLPRDIQPAIQKRLQMFVLRSKVKLADLSSDMVALGLAGSAAEPVLREKFGTLPQQAYDIARSEAGTLIRMPDADGKPRYQWIVDRETAEQCWARLTGAVAPAGPQAWRLTEIRAGLPRITLATQEQFVPQMVNFEVIGGVNFRKGCYPGQEIVARSQYLGKLKRRMALAGVAADTVGAGMEVFSEDDPGQPCGMIVNAERSAEGRFECLVEMKTAALDSGQVRLGSPQGPVLQFVPLPYPLPDASAALRPSADGA